ncbi:MarR family winged helix-turn-helix transcriptional regulator [Microbacterium sp. LMI1-1-1.1]|uniref:MarR family winged helix-turn-helix transcriptional regulator n=1 Tax=Microbacterium sp. LMI1-1-1.1 TaxID=3135223 RepID=UPI0034655F79
MIETMTSESPVAGALQRYMRERTSCLADARRLLGLNELDVTAVLHVSKHPGIRPSELRNHLGITSAGVTTIVERLVRRDILRRESDNEDRRASHIYAQVELSVEPWNCLTRFDDTFNTAISQLHPEVQRDVAEFLDAATTTAAVKNSAGSVP